MFSAWMQKKKLLVRVCVCISLFTVRQKSYHARLVHDRMKSNRYQKRTTTRRRHESQFQNVIQSIYSEQQNVFSAGANKLFVHVLSNLKVREKKQKKQNGTDWRKKSIKFLYLKQQRCNVTQSTYQLFIIICAASTSATNSFKNSEIFLCSAICTNWISTHSPTALVRFSFCGCTAIHFPSASLSKQNVTKL